MYILLTDETNREASPNAKFFVYGGLFFPITELRQLDEKIEAIRLCGGFKPEDDFKFDTRSKPDHVPFDKFTDAKSKLLDECKATGCRFIVHVILHEIIKNQDPEQQAFQAADYVFGRFNTFLRTEANAYGLCVIDNLPTKNQYRYLSTKFKKGLVLNTGTEVPLRRLKLFATSCIGASHASSAMDIVLGSFRYCINNPKNPTAARRMLGKVVDLLWHDRRGEKIFATHKGLIIRPKLDRIQIPDYRREYDRLFEHINSLLKDHE